MNKQPLASVFRLNIHVEDSDPNLFYQNLPDILRKTADDIESKNFRSKAIENKRWCIGWWTIRNRFKER